MQAQDDIFTVKLQMPAGARLDYGFLITKKRNGVAIQPVWDGQEAYHTTPTEDDLIEVQAGVSLTRATPLTSVDDVGLRLFLGLGGVIGLTLILLRLPMQQNQQLIALAGLTLLGLAFRFWVAGGVERLLASPPQLIGDEPRYDALAYELLQGKFFEWPSATPIYPFLLAAAYFVFGHTYGPVLFIQALLGAVAIPLTYRLAQRFVGDRVALVAAELVAILPPLVAQVGYLYTEVLYTCLLLLTVLALLSALEKPSLPRFILAGLILGVTTLTRPPTILLPICLLFLLPRIWSLRRRLILWFVYGTAMVAVIAPWSLHNYLVHKRFIPFSYSLTMLWAGSPEFYHVMEQEKDALITVWSEELNPAHNGGHDPLTIEGDRYFNERAIASIRAEPGLYIWYSLQKLAYFWIGHPGSIADWPFDFELLPYFSAGDIVGLFIARLLLVLLAVAALIILRGRLGRFALLFVVCANLMLTYAVLNAVARYSEPLYPLLAVFIAAALEQVLNHYQSYRQQHLQQPQTGSMTAKPSQG
jgi:4-amino-4-deoxy-L-arabinose transferase-like glycosyltransferase